MGGTELLIASAVQGIGAGMSAAGQMRRAEEEHYLAQQQVRFLRMQAGHARETGAWQEGQQRMQAGRLAAAQRVALSNSGVDPSTGTAAALQRETAVLSDLDAAMIRTNAARQAWGLGMQADIDSQAADLRRRAQRQQAGMTFLGGLTDAGMTYYQYRGMG
ncbi:MAG: hypothetical protein ACOC0J_02010 [Myxococcota bacterium]